MMCYYLNVHFQGQRVNRSYRLRRLYLGLCRCAHQHPRPPASFPLISARPDLIPTSIQQQISGDTSKVKSAPKPTEACGGTQVVDKVVTGAYKRAGTHRGYCTVLRVWPVVYLAEQEGLVW